MYQINLFWKKASGKRDWSANIGVTRTAPIKIRVFWANDYATHTNGCRHRYEVQLSGISNGNFFQWSTDFQDLQNQGHAWARYRAVMLARQYAIAEKNQALLDALNASIKRLDCNTSNTVNLKTALQLTGNWNRPFNCIKLVNINNPGERDILTVSELKKSYDVRKMKVCKFAPFFIGSDLEGTEFGGAFWDLIK